MAIGSFLKFKDTSLQSELNLAEEAARAAGKVLKQNFLTDAGITKAAGKDLKTQADLTAEKIILDILSASPHPRVSEEADAPPELPAKGPCWIVDPLDGTMNFARGFPLSCVSIALWTDGKPTLGVILDLNGDHLYRGVVGQGAEVDGKPLQVSAIAEVGQSVMATGFPTGRSYDSENLAKFISCVKQFKKIRMIGSAALSLTYVASGVWEIYHEENVFLWDVAAGLALVEAAGGEIAFSPLASNGTFTVTASNGRVTL
ncbi:MAG: inositol monophosphatase [Opitutae bacterium]|nr:inositol monophosphatase [Opitutae bacterium]